MKNSPKTVLFAFISIMFGIGALLTPSGFVRASSIYIYSLTPGSVVVPGNEVTFTVVSSGFTATPSYSIVDSFKGGSITNTNINSAGVFDWVATNNDGGLHTLVITATSPHGESATISQDITVEGATPPPQTWSLLIQSLTPGPSVSIGQTASFTAAPLGLTNPTYRVSDTFSGSSIIPENINKTNGFFNWTPVAQDVGTHNITVSVTDSLGHGTSVFQQIIVDPAGTTKSSDPVYFSSMAILSISPKADIVTGQKITFKVSSAGISNPVYTVKDSLPGSSIANANINSSGFFSWNPGTNDSGTHTITVYASNSLNQSTNATVKIRVTPGTDIATISVQSPPTTPVQSSPSPSVGYTFTSYLSPGLTSKEVTALQNFLKKQGLFSGPISGFYGQQTEMAVKAFQKANGLAQIGVVGPATRAKLNAQN